MEKSTTEVIGTSEIPETEPLTNTTIQGNETAKDTKGIDNIVRITIIAGSIIGGVVVVVFIGMVVRYLNRRWTYWFPRIPTSQIPIFIVREVMNSTIDLIQTPVLALIRIIRRMRTIHISPIVSNPPTRPATPASNTRLSPDWNFFDRSYRSISGIIQSPGIPSSSSGTRSIGNTEFWRRTLRLTNDNPATPANSIRSLNTPDSAKRYGKLHRSKKAGLIWGGSCPELGMMSFNTMPTSPPSLKNIEISSSTESISLTSLQSLQPLFYSTPAPSFTQSDGEDAVNLVEEGQNSRYRISTPTQFPHIAWLQGNNIL